MHVCGCVVPPTPSPAARTGTGKLSPEAWLQSAGINLANPTTRAAMEAEGLRSHGPAPSARRPAASAEVSSSVILICKVFLGNCLSSEEPEVGPVDVDAEGERRGPRTVQVKHGRLLEPGAWARWGGDGSAGGTARMGGLTVSLLALQRMSVSCQISLWLWPDPNLRVPSRPSVS